MKRILCSTAILLSLTVNISSIPACAQESGAIEKPKLFTPAQTREDFKIVRNALEEGHPGVYRYTPKKDMDRLFDEQESKLDHPMDVYDFFRIVAPVIAAVRCGHTGVNPSVEENERFDKSVPVLPFQIRMIGNKITIFRDYTSEDGGLAGSKIHSINGMRSDKIVKLLLALESGDGDIPTSRLRQLGQTFSKKLSIFLKMKAPYTVTYSPFNGGKAQSVTLAGITSTRLKEIAGVKYPQDNVRRDHSADLSFLDENKIAVMSIYGFVGFADKEQKKPLNAFIDESFAQFAQKGTKTLIIDVRNNGGGEDELGKQLFSYLIDKPFPYYDELLINALKFGFLQYAGNAEAIPENLTQKLPDGRYRLTSHPNWGIQQPGKPMFRGRVLILINGGSFSTTGEFLSTVHFHHRAVFIGEEAGAGYYGNNSGFMHILTLPNTQVRIRVPLMKYVMAVSGYRYPRRGVMPDVKVQPTIADMLAGRDPEMAVALDIARGKRTK